MQSHDTTRACRHCGVEFTPRHHNHRVCSPYCCKQHGPRVTIIACEICGASVPVVPSRAKRTRFCSRTCASIGHRRPVLIHCLHCGKEFQINRSQQSVKRYCSKACKFAGLNVQDTRTCAWCQKSFKVSRTKDDRFCSKPCWYADTKSKRITKECLTCGTTFDVVQSQATIARFCCQPCFFKYRGDTTLEERVRMALNALGIKFEREYPISRYSIDFYLTDYHIALEADGEYWHRIAAERDARRDAFLLKRGITTVRILETEITDTNAIAVVSRYLEGLVPLPLGQLALPW